jgi:hypothetical protein
LFRTRRDGTIENGLRSWLSRERTIEAVARALRIAGAAILLAMGTNSCSYHAGAVSHGLGGDKFTGYSVDYGDATPSPGSALVQGEVVRVTVRVRYSLQSAKQGRLILYFDEGSGLEGRATAIDIVRTDGRQEATLSREITVPPRKSSLVVNVGVFPGRATETIGQLRISYRVLPPRKP